MTRIEQLGAFGEKSPNHVLVNEYLPGQGIMVSFIIDRKLSHPISQGLQKHMLLSGFIPKNLQNVTVANGTHHVLLWSLTKGLHHGLDQVCQHGMHVTPTVIPPSAA